jgi:signal recognition particle subunit SRP68
MSDTTPSREPTESAVDVSSFAKLTFDILSYLKVTQVNNGLRHSDYDRYRQYSSRRIRRLRLALKFTHPSKQFKPRPVQPEDVSNINFLILVLTESERAWAYSMQLKGELDQDNSRKRFHLLKRLKRAVDHAKHLNELCRARADTKTQLQAESYYTQTLGLYYFEKELHSQALQQFLRAQQLYSELGSVSSADVQGLCEERSASLSDHIRVCKYVAAKGNNTENDEELINITDDSDLSAKLQALKKEKIEHQAKSLDQVEFQGQTIPVANEKTRLLLVQSKQYSEQIKKKQNLAGESKNTGEKGQEDEESADSEHSESALLSKLALNYDEALRIITADITQVKLEQHKANLINLQNYCIVNRINAHIARTNLLANSLRQRYSQQEITNSAAGKGKKRVKPEELVGVYEKLITFIAELVELSEKNKYSQLLTQANSSKTAYNISRIYYLAEFYRRMNKLHESYVLYQRVATLAREVNISSLSPADSALVSAISHEAESSKLVAQASLILAQQHSAEEITAGVEKLKVSSPEKESKTNAAAQGTVVERLDEFFIVNNINELKLVNFPPKLQPAPSKPILFDLAFNAVQFPDLNKRIKVKQAEHKKSEQKQQPNQGKPLAAPAKANKSQEHPAQAAQATSPATQEQSKGFFGRLWGR